MPLGVQIEKKAQTESGLRKQEDTRRKSKSVRKAGSKALRGGKHTGKRWPVGEAHLGSEEKYTQEVTS